MQTDDLLRRLQYDQEFRQEVRRLVLSEELLTLPEKTERLRAELHEEIRRFWQGLDAWREEMREGFAVMREEFSRVWDAISATRQEMHEEFSRVWDAISATRQEMHEEIRELRTEMREEFSRVWDAISATRQEMHEEFGRLWKGFQEVKEQLSLMSLNLEKLATIVEKQSVDIGDLKGRLLEREWRDKAPAFLSRWFRGLRVIDYPELSRMMEKAEAEGLLTEEEGTQLMVTDVIAEGRLKKDGTVSRVVVEVSWTIGRSDVQRARERAQILSRLGVPTVAIVCGSAIGEQVLHEAAEQNVWVLVDGARKDNRFYSFRSQLLE